MIDQAPSGKRTPVSRLLSAAAATLGGRFAVPVLVGLLLWLTAWRVQTYAIAHDSAQYIQMARLLLDAPWGSDLFREVLLFVAPVYPVVLALSIQMTGLMAPYWLGLVWLVGSFAIWAALIDRISRTTSDRNLALLVMVFFLIAGNPTNAYFLMYPFRESFSFLLILISFWCLVAGVEKRPRLLAFAAGCAAIGAVGTREPSVCAIPGSVLYILFAERGAFRQRLPRLVCFLAPFLLVALAGLAAVWYLDLGLNLQLRSWIGVVTKHSPGELARVFLHGAERQGQFFWDELGWPGVALVLLGIAHWRRRAAPMFLFFLTAILLFAFYSTVGEPHRRFYLAVHFFIVPLAGGGMCLLAGWVDRLQAIWRPGRTDAPGLRLLAGTAWVAGLLVVIFRLEPWGPYVSRSDIRSLRDVVDSLIQAATPGIVPNAPTGTAGSATCAQLNKFRTSEKETPFLARFQHGRRNSPLFVVEMNNDYLKAALASHTDARFAVQRYVREEWAAGWPVYYIKPLDPACVFRGRMIPNLGPPVEDILKQYADLTPVPGDDGEPVEITLGDGRYAFIRVEPWSQTQTRVDAGLPTAGAGILAIDLKGLCCQFGREGDRTRLLLGDAVISDQPGCGVHYYYVSNAPARSAEVVLESAGPVPADLSVDWLASGATIAMDLSELAIPLHWSILDGGGWNYATPFWRSQQDARVNLPVPFAAPGMLLAEFKLRGRMGDGSPLSLGIYDASNKVATVALASHKRFETVIVTVDVDQPNRARPIEFRREGGGSHTLEIKSVRLRLLPKDQPLQLDLGRWDDDLYARDGLHHREKDERGVTLRWTDARAELQCFLPKAQEAWEAHIVFSDSNRPAHVPPAQMRVSFNGEPLDMVISQSPTSRWQTAVLSLPAHSVRRGANQLIVESVTWSPAQAHGSPDSRNLGVMIDRVELIRK